MKFTAEQKREILRVIGEWHPDVDNERLEDGDVDVLRDELAMALGNAMGLDNDAALRIMESERAASAERARRIVQGWKSG